MGLLLSTSLSFAQAPVIGSMRQISVDPSSNCANETTSVSTSNGQEIIGGFNDYRSDGTIKSGFGVSNDGGSTWTHVLIRPPVGNQTTVEGDPFTIYDRRTNTVWACGMSFANNGGIYIAKKNPGLNTFQASTMARVSSISDKAWGVAGPLPGNPNSTRIYITYNEGIIRSDDGVTFSAPTSLGTGLGFLPRVGPNGELYVTYWDDSTGVMFKRSLDGGLTFATVRAATRMDTWGTESPNGRVPGTYRIPPIQTMAVNPVNGTIAIMYFDTTNTIGSNRNLDLYMVVSTNQGTSWSTPTRLPFRPLGTVGDMFFPWLEYTLDGRLHLLAFDSSYVNQNDGIAHGLLDQDYAYSDNDGGTWTKFRLTPTSFDSFNDGRGASASFMGDYSGIGISDRRVFPVFLDTQNGGADTYTSVVFNPIVRPTSLTFPSGVQTAGTIGSLYLQDGDLVAAKTAPFGTPGVPPIQMQISATSPNPNPTSLQIYLWTSASVFSVQQRLLMLNATTGQWDLVDTRAAGTTLTNSVISVPNPQNYVAANGAISARIAFQPIGSFAPSSWSMQADEAVFLVSP